MSSMANKQARPLSCQDIQQLLNLQQLFHSRYLTQQLLTEMIRLYVQAVDNFNKQNCIKNYFMGKIQMVVSRPQIISLLQKNDKDPQEMSRETIRIMEQKNTNTKENQSNQQLISNLEPQERDIKIKMQLKIMREVKENIQQISKDVDEADQKGYKHTKQIHHQIQKQDNDLNARLQKRKNKRKKSVDLYDIEKLQYIEINKMQLISAQKELTQAVVRFTARMTQRQQTHRQQPQIRTIKESQKIQQQQNGEQEDNYFDTIISDKQQPVQSIYIDAESEVNIKDEMEKQQQVRHQTSNKQSHEIRQGTRKGTHMEHDPNDVGRITYQTQDEQQDDDYF